MEKPHDEFSGHGGRFEIGADGVRRRVEGTVEHPEGQPAAGPDATEAALQPAATPTGAVEEAQTAPAPQPAPKTATPAKSRNQ